MAGNAKFGIKIEGDTSLRLAMAANGDPKAVDRAVQTAATKAAAPIAKQAKAMAPVRTGRLKRAIKAKRARYERPGAIATINPGKKRDDMGGAYYRYIVTSGIPSRGYAGRPFMDQAFSMVGGEATKIFEDTIEDLITNKLVPKSKRK
jgi:hypothetical protein